LLHAAAATAGGDRSGGSGRWTERQLRAGGWAGGRWNCVPGGRICPSLPMAAATEPLTVTGDLFARVRQAGARAAATVACRGGPRWWWRRRRRRAAMHEEIRRARRLYGISLRRRWKASPETTPRFAPPPRGRDAPAAVSTQAPARRICSHTRRMRSTAHHRHHSGTHPPPPPLEPPPAAGSSQGEKDRERERDKGDRRKKKGNEREDDMWIYMRGPFVIQKIIVGPTDIWVPHVILSYPFFLLPFLPSLSLPLSLRAWGAASGSAAATAGDGWSGSGGRAAIGVVDPKAGYAPRFPSSS